MKKFYSSQKGFTLIELLIVIVIIGILSGVVLTVINPAQQMRRARQTVFRANAEKGCLAFLACTGSTTSAVTCSGSTDALALTAIGFTDPLNPAATTGITAPIYKVSPLSPAVGDTLTFTSTYDGCIYTCSASPTNGTVTQFARTDVSATCMLQ